MHLKKHKMFGLDLTKIDPALQDETHLHRVNPYSCTQTRVVEKDGQRYVLKAVHVGNENILYHIDSEADNLWKARDVKGITHLVEDYGTIGEWRAILKEYVPGTDLDLLDSRLENKSQIRRQLERTVAELHGRGIYGIEPIPKNIVLSPDMKTATIVDLGNPTLPQFRKNPLKLRNQDFDDLRLGLAFC